MRWKSEYPESYTDGVVNKSVTLSRVAYDLLEENDIQNSSAFINDLLIDALQEKDFFKKRMLASINRARNELKQKYGIETEFCVSILRNDIPAILDNIEKKEKLDEKKENLAEKKGDSDGKL